MDTLIDNLLVSFVFSFSLIGYKISLNSFGNFLINGTNSNTISYALIGKRIFIIEPFKLGYFVFKSFNFSSCDNDLVYCEANF